MFWWFVLGVANGALVVWLFRMFVCPIQGGSVDPRDLKNFELSFEHGVEGQSPEELWRLVSRRPYGDGERTITHVNWFATLTAARQHADWIADGRGKVVGMDLYRKVGSDPV